MQSKLDKDHILVKLEDGEDLFDCLKKVLDVHNTKSFAVEFGIGMLRDFTIGYFNGNEYENREIHDPMELVALHGLVAEDSIHLHCAVADNQNNIVGGHLFSATVNVVNEILLLKFSKIQIRRELNESTGLMEFRLD